MFDPFDPDESNLRRKVVAAGNPAERSRGTKVREMQTSDIDVKWSANT